MINVPAIVRGREFPGSDIVVEGDAQSAVQSLSSDLIERMIDVRAADLSSFQSVPLSEILDLLDAAGNLLETHWAEFLEPAFQAALPCSKMGPSVLRAQFERLPLFFKRERVLSSIGRAMDPRLLDGWVEYPTLSEYGHRVARRAFGSRCVHIIAGNTPSIAATTIIRSAVTHCDAVIKIPSNDPLTAIALLRALRKVDATHPVASHLSAAYWKGNNSETQRRILGSQYPEKIIAWGGLPTVQAALAYVSHHTEVVTFNPKVSRSIVDLRLAQDENTLTDAASRLASDIATLDQEACFNTRIAYVIVPQGANHLAKSLARKTLEWIDSLPEQLSSPAWQKPEPKLEEELEGLFYGSEDHLVMSGTTSSIVLSIAGEPVEFAELLGGKVCNFVVVNEMDDALRGLDKSTQTLSIYPDSVRQEIRDRAALRGVQRIVSCGAARYITDGAPHDGMEPMRRLCSWITDEAFPDERRPSRQEQTALSSSATSAD